ncbi:MAG: pitrilysin family protein [SAR202 cluster bacterium]|nr:pitrilysin family protein [SAR202 cluster bacterium]
MVSIAFDKFTLPNGLDVILSEDHSLPVTAVNVWYHVGSKNEEPGRTGFAHLFEHVMFEGSKHHNHSYFDPLQKVGANLNGSTTPDRTNYWENLPSNYLDLALWLESDRMGFLLDALDQKRFEVQRDIVKNERRQNYENRPYGMASMIIQPNLYPAPHPYNWTTIGSPEDLDEASLDDIKAFFQKFYSPSNASLAIVGDFDAARVRDRVEKYFGEIPSAPAVDRIGRMDSNLRGQASLTTHDRVQLPRLYLVWPTGPIFDNDQAPLDLMASILGDGKSSRLYRTLVYDRQIAREVRVEHYAQEIAGEFSIQVTANPGHSLEEIEAVIAEELDRLRSAPPTDEELQRARTRIETSHVMQLERFGGFGGRADQLNYYNTLRGDPDAINTDVQRYLDVSVEDIHKATSILGENQVRLVVNPEEAREAAATAIDRTSAPVAAPEPRFSPPVPQRATLANGLEIVHLERGGVPAVAFGLVLSGGALADPAAKSGLANLTATMLAEGTRLRTSKDISDQLEALGTHLRHHASREFAMVSCDSLVSNWRKALAILAEVARDSVFPDHELERVRKDLMTDFSRIVDNPLAIASRAARSLFYGPGTPYGHPLTGNEQSVATINRDDLESFHQSHFGPSDATFIVVGSVSLDDAVEAAEAAFGDWQVSASSTPDGPSAESNGRTPTRIYIADKPGAAQSIIRAGHLTVPRAHAHYLRLTMLNYIFGGQFASRLNNNLRQDKGYSYGYSSMIDWSHGPSMLMVGGGVQTAVTKEALFETIKEFNEIRSSRPVTQEEFIDARDGILRSIPGQFETQQQVLQHLTRMVVFGLPDDYFTTFADNVSEIALDDIHQAAEDMLDTDHLRILVVGDGDTIRDGVAELGLPVSDVDYEGRILE